MDTTSQDLLLASPIGSIDDIEFDLGFEHEEIPSTSNHSTTSLAFPSWHPLGGSSHHSCQSSNNNFLPTGSNHSCCSDNLSVFALDASEEEDLMNLLDEADDERIMSVVLQQTTTEEEPLPLVETPTNTMSLGKKSFGGFSASTSTITPPPPPTVRMTQPVPVTTATAPQPIPTSSSNSNSSPTTPPPDVHQEMSQWGEWDVPLGRAQEVREFIGNVRFRDLVEHYRPAYHATTRKPEKTTISTTIFQTIAQNGGRFLDKKKTARKTVTAQGTCTTVYEWFEIPQDKALAKISQALRLGTRPVRKFVAPVVAEWTGYQYQAQQGQQQGYYPAAPPQYSQNPSCLTMAAAEGYPQPAHSYYSQQQHYHHHPQQVGYPSTHKLSPPEPVGEPEPQLARTR